MADEFGKTSYVVGAAVAKATDVRGDNVAANAVRGFMIYHDPDLRKQRQVGVENDKAAFKAYLLAKS